MVLLMPANLLIHRRREFLGHAPQLQDVLPPLLAVRLRRTQAERYAGLRTLAKD